MGPWFSALLRQGGDMAQKQAGRIAASVGLWAAGGIFALVALGFATAGVYVAIRNALGPIPALFIMAAIFVAFAIIAFVVAGRRGRRRPPQPDPELREFRMDSEAARLASLGTVASAFAFGLVRGLARRRRP